MQVAERLYSAMKNGKMKNIDNILRNRERLNDINYFSIDSYNSMEFKIDLDIALKEIELNEIQRLILGLTLKDTSIDYMMLVTGLSRKNLHKHRKKIADKLQNHFREYP